VAKRNPGRRGRSRKRRSKPKQAEAAASARGAEDAPPPGLPATPSRAATPSRPATRGGRRDAGAVGELHAYGERPRPPWYPLPLSELLILVGGIGVIVAWARGIQSEAALLAASIGAVVIGTIEVTLREHLSGYRSHTVMLAVIPAIVLHSVVVLLVLALSGHVPSWLNIVLLPIDAALVAVFYKLLRARFVDARRERTFAAGR
jgi:hypothetical protein